jgi:hypothetical protein
MKDLVSMWATASDVTTNRFSIEEASLMASLLLRLVSFSLCLWLSAGSHHELVVGQFW